MSRDGFYQHLAATFATFGREITDIESELFLADIEAAGVDWPDATSALSTYRRSGHKFAPRVGQIIEIINGKSEDAASVAWGKANRAVGSCGMYANVVFDDPKIMNAIELWGGWAAFCRRDADSEMADRAHFRKLYDGASSKKCTAVLKGAFGNECNDAPRMIGDPGRCQKILEYGKRGPMLQIEPAGQTMSEFGLVGDTCKKILTSNDRSVK